MGRAERPKVSVAIVAHNHEPFIAQAIEGVLAQKIDFDLEIIVGEDRSTDRTAEVVQDYVNRYPNIVRMVRSESNVGLFQNCMQLLNACNGDYVAIMDGDDRWAYEYKLQKQVDFLENNKDYSGSFHDAEIVVSDQDDKNTQNYLRAFRLYSQFNRYNSDLHPWELVERTIIPTSSFVFRNIPLENELMKFKDICESLDWVTELLVIKHGRFKYFNGAWSIYNNNRGGMTKNVKVKVFIDNVVKVLYKLLKDDYYRNFKHHIYRSLAEESLHEFFLDDPDIKKTYRIKLIFRYCSCQVRHVFYRVRSLWSQL